MMVNCTICQPPWWKRVTRVEAETSRYSTPSQHCVQQHSSDRLFQTWEHTYPPSAASSPSRSRSTWGIAQSTLCYWTSIVGRPPSGEQSNGTPQEPDPLQGFFLTRSFPWEGQPEALLGRERPASRSPVHGRHDVAATFPLLVAGPRAGCRPAGPVLMYCTVHGVRGSILSSDQRETHVPVARLAVRLVPRLQRPTRMAILKLLMVFI